MIVKIREALGNTYHNLSGDPSEILIIKEEVRHSSGSPKKRCVTAGGVVGVELQVQEQITIGQPLHLSSREIPN